MTDSVDRADRADRADNGAGDPAMAAALGRAEQLGVVTDAAPLLLGYVDAGLVYRFVNQTYERWFGHPSAQVEGRTMEEVLGPAAFAVIRPYVEAALAGQEVTFEQEVPYKDGGVRHVHGTYVPARDERGQVQGFVVVVADISQAKHHEHERKRLLSELRYLSAHARCLLWRGTLALWADGSFHWDLDVLDPAAAQAFLPLDLLPGESYPDAWYRHRLPEGKAVTEAAWRQALDTGQPSYSAEFGCRGADGQVRWIEERVYVAPLLLERLERRALGRQVRRCWRMVGVAVDITERKQAQEERARLLADVLAAATGGKLRLVDEAEQLPPRLPPVEEPVALTAETLRQARHQSAAAARAQDFPDERIHELEIAVGEATANAVRWGRGGVAAVGAAGEKHTVQVWVEDQGNGIDLSRLPRAALEAGYSGGVSLGQGFFLILNVCDKVWLRTGPSGTTVVLEMDRTEPEPGWLANFDTAFDVTTDGAGGQPEG